MKSEMPYEKNIDSGAETPTPLERDRGGNGIFHDSVASGVRKRAQHDVPQRA